MMSFAPFLPPLHAGGPEPVGPWFTHWFLDPKTAVAIFGLTGAYLLWVGPLNRRRPGADTRPVTTRQVVSFLFGSLVALIALGPPLDDWSDYFLASAHMLEHLLLMLACVPLWIAGIPAWVYRPLVDNRWIRRSVGWFLHPVTAFVFANLIMAVWHIPGPYDLALRVEFWHFMEHAMFIVAGVLLWWPLMSKVPAWPALPPPAKALYIFLQSIPSGIIGALLTYADPLYPFYAQASVRPWGLGLQLDQEIAGLMMWVGMNTVFLIVASTIFLRWAVREEQQDNAALRRKAAPPQPPVVNLPAGQDA